MNQVQETKGYVRDASADNGKLVADEAYEEYLREYHPDYKTKFYRLPSTTIYRPCLGKRVKLTEADKFLMMKNQSDHIRGDNAEKKAADSLERMLEVSNSTAFMITNYEFKHFCSEKNEPPLSDKNVYIEKGEHDILIISFDLGIFFIQVKGIEEGSDPEVIWKKAKEQTEKDTNFFKKNFEHLTKLTMKAAIAFPNIDLQTLKDRYRNLFEDHIEKYQDDDLLQYLFDDHLSGSIEDENKDTRLKEWWERSSRNCVGFRSFDDYKRVVAQYIGRKSTVSIRTQGECVSLIGNRYMNILLTPQQVAILTSGSRRLIIRGQYGTGKTLLLILKIRQIIADRVCIISMAKSPLIHVIEASVKDGMTTALSNNISVVQGADSGELKVQLENCRKNKCHIFIDEMPSSLQHEKSLLELIKNYPQDYLIWAVMSSEISDHLSDNLGKMFDITESNVSPDRFRVTVLNKVLRCPPSIFPRPTGVLNLSQRDGFKRNKENLSRFFTSHGLRTDKMSSSGEQTRETMKWSDIVVVDANTTDSEFHIMLKNACIPLTYCKNIADVAQNNFKNAQKEVHGRKTALYVQCLPFNYPVLENLAANVKGGKVYMPTTDKTKQIDTQRDLEEFLCQFGIDAVKLRQKAISEEAKRSLLKCMFVDKPELYFFLENLGIPLVTPCNLDKVLTENAILYTDEENRGGFLESRKLVLHFVHEIVTINDEVVSMEGPSPIHIDHTKHGVERIDTCDDCLTIFRLVLNKLGLQVTVRPVEIDNCETENLGRNIPPQNAGGVQDRQLADDIIPQMALMRVQPEDTQMVAIQPEDAEVPAEQPEDAKVTNILSQHRMPQQSLHWSDVVVLDDRNESDRDVADLLQQLVPVVVKLQPGLPNKDDGFGYLDKILYTIPESFKGLERKVVVVIVDNADNSDLARSRCSSQLIVLRANQRH